MSQESITRINQAVKACLHHCYAATQPLATLAEFAEMLRTDPDWSERDIAVVQTKVRRMLRMIQNPSDSGVMPPDVMGMTG